MVLLEQKEARRISTIEKPTAPLANLGANARSAAIWNGGFLFFRDLLQFGVTLVLVRLLAPAAYGQFSLITSIIGFFSIFSFKNFVAYTIQVKSDEEAEFQEHFTAGAVLQSTIFSITNLVAMALRWVPAYAPVAPLVHVMSLTFLLEWPCEVRRKMIERQFNWGLLRTMHAVGLILMAIIAIVMALLGSGTYALLVPGLVVTLPFTYDLFFRQHWRPTWQWSWQSYRPAWRFGLARLSSGLTLQGRQLLESGIFSAMLGFGVLGVLNRSLGLSQMFCLRFASELITAIYPVLTRVGGGEANTERVGGMILRILAWMVLPVATCFAVLARPIILTIYGSRWTAAIPLLPWAMAWSALAALAYGCYMLLLSRSGQRKCFLVDLISLVGTVLSLLLALPHGIVAYLMSLALAQGVIILLLFFWMRQCNIISWHGIFEAIFPALAAGTAAFVFAMVTVWSIAVDRVTFIGACVWGGTFIASYIATLRIGFVRQLSALLYYVPGRVPICRVLIIPLNL
jgi:O-antigen/teichoic acid export membrane protein